MPPPRAAQRERGPQHRRESRSSCLHGERLLEVVRDAERAEPRADSRHRGLELLAVSALSIAFFDAPMSSTSNLVQHALSARDRARS
jgi:hypothetical protein